MPSFLLHGYNRFLHTTPTGNLATVREMQLKARSYGAEKRIEKNVQPFDVANGAQPGSAAHLASFDHADARRLVRCRC